MNSNPFDELEARMMGGLRVSSVSASGGVGEARTVTTAPKKKKTATWDDDDDDEEEFRARKQKEGRKKNVKEKNTRLDDDANERDDESASSSSDDGKRKKNERDRRGGRSSKKEDEEEGSSDDGERAMGARKGDVRDRSKPERRRVDDVNDDEHDDDDDDERRTTKKSSRSKKDKKKKKKKKKSSSRHRRRSDSSEDSTESSSSSSSSDSSSSEEDERSRKKKKKSSSSRSRRRAASSSSSDGEQDNNNNSASRKQEPSTTTTKPPPVIPARPSREVSTAAVKAMATDGRAGGLTSAGTRAGTPTAIPVSDEETVGLFRAFDSMDERQAVVMESDVGRLDAVTKQLLDRVQEAKNITAQCENVSGGEAALFDDIASPLARGSFVCTVTGPMKAGKSTLINAIVSNSILPSRTFAMTILPTIVEHSHESCDPDLVLPESERFTTSAAFVKRCIELKSRFAPTMTWSKRMTDLEALWSNGENSEKPTAEAIGREALFGDARNVFPPKATREAAGEVLMKANIVIRLHLSLINIFHETYREDERPDGSVASARQHIASAGMNECFEEPLGYLKRVEKSPRLRVHLPLFERLPASTRVWIVDTPGPNEASKSACLPTLCRDIYSDSDAILFAVDTSTIEGDTAMKVRDELITADSQSKANKPLYLVMNKFDLTTPPPRQPPSEFACECQRKGASILLADPNAVRKVAVVSARLMELAHLGRQAAEVAYANGHKTFNAPNKEYAAKAGLDGVLNKMIRQRSGANVDTARPVPVGLGMRINVELRKKSNMASLCEAFRLLCSAGRAGVIARSAERLIKPLTLTRDHELKRIEMLRKSDAEITKALNEIEDRIARVRARWPNDRSAFVRDILEVESYISQTLRNLLNTYIDTRNQEYMNQRVRNTRYYKARTDRVVVFGNSKANREFADIIDTGLSHIRSYVKEFGQQHEAEIKNRISSVFSRFNSRTSSSGISGYDEVVVDLDRVATWTLRRDSEVMSAPSNHESGALYSEVCGAAAALKMSSSAAPSAGVHSLHVTRRSEGMDKAVQKNMPEASSFGTALFVDFLFTAGLSTTALLGWSTLVVGARVAGGVYNTVVGDKNSFPCSDLVNLFDNYARHECTSAVREWTLCVLNKMLEEACSATGFYYDSERKMAQLAREMKMKMTAEDKKQKMAKSEELVEKLGACLGGVNTVLAELQRPPTLLLPDNAISFGSDFTSFD